MYKSSFEIKQMDCHSEESLIRMKLNENEGVKHVNVDLASRCLTVFHTGDIQSIDDSLDDLKLGSVRRSTEITNETDFQKDANQKKVLWIVLSINFLFFGIEMTTGVIAKSMGLVADSLDMLADTVVYGISLLAVGGTVVKKKNIAKLAGFLQIVLACIGFLEVIRRFLYAEQLPNFVSMIVVSIFALVANASCLIILQKSKSIEEAHMKASMIFTSNDVIINVGVIVAGVLVHWLNSSNPDLIIGTVVFVLVIQGALRILKLSK